jgi:hypothetical protein
MGALLLFVLASGCAVRPGVHLGNSSPIVGEFVGPGLTANSVLQTFKFRFLNEDHHLDHVRLLEEGGSARALFGDASPQDPWELTADYLELAGIETMKKDMDCLSREGFCDIDLGHDVVNGEFRFALVGFEFQRINGRDDHHIKAIGILPIDNRLRVTFHDDSPGDDQFKCIVQYKLVPFNRESGFPVRLFKSGGNSRRIEEALGGDPDDRVLSGFQFNYTHGGDAHVLALGVDVASGTVSFQDNDTAEGISWDVTYLHLEDFR